jgi:hypothetical protein
MSNRMRLVTLLCNVKARARHNAGSLERRLEHLGKFEGVTPTGKRIEFIGHSIERVVEGKIVESWVEVDMLGVMQQLGAVPEPGQTGEASRSQPRLLPSPPLPRGPRAAASCPRGLEEGVERR